MLNKLKFVSSTKQSIQSRDTSNKVISDFEKIKFENSLSPSKNKFIENIEKNKIHYGNFNLSLKNSSFKKRNESLLITDNLQNKFMNDVINKCLYDDSSNLNYCKSTSIKSSDFKESIFSKFSKTKKSSNAKEKENLKFIIINDIKISQQFL